jgi:hypothetical protein
MINPGAKILKAWFDLLDGSLSVPVYRTDAPYTETGNYVLLRLESSTELSNKHHFITRPVIITEVVTKFDSMIDDSIAIEIDSEISSLLKTTVGRHNLPDQDGIEINGVSRVNQTILPEDNGSSPKINRLITRNVHIVSELVDES